MNQAKNQNIEMVITDLDGTLLNNNREVSLEDMKSLYWLGENNIIRVVELLLNRHHFKDEKLTISNKLEENGFISIDRTIKKDLSSLSSEELTKLFGTIYRSIHRHNVSSREYIDFIHAHVGLRVGKGVRLIKDFS